MWRIILSALACTPMIACAAEAQRCSIAQVREVVLSQQRGGPEAAEENNLHHAQGVRYNVTLNCGKERLRAVFLSENGFDDAHFPRGTEVAVTIDGSTVLIRAANKYDARGQLVNARK